MRLRAKSKGVGTSVPAILISCVIAVDLEAQTCNDMSPPGLEICGQWVAIPYCQWPPGSACPSGSWPAGAQAAHAVLVRDGVPPLYGQGKVLLWRVTIDNSWNVFGSHYWDWRSPGTGAQDQRLGPTPDYSDLFCSGQTVLSDGRVLAVGGQDWDQALVDSTHKPHGTTESYIFDPAQPGWVRTTGNMASRRWYPTATTLPDERVITTSGLVSSDDPEVGGNQEVYASTPERFDPSLQTWSQLSTAGPTNMATYPFIHVLPGASTRILHSGPKRQTGDKLQTLENLDSGSPFWQATGQSSVLDGDAIAMYDKGRVLKAAGKDPNPPPPPAEVFATPRAERIEAPNGAVTSITEVASMNKGRNEHNLVVLPTGEILAVGGGKKNLHGGLTLVDAVWETEIYSPTANQWRYAARMDTHRNPDIPRMYHSTAVLLPDGSVLVAGGEVLNDPNISNDGCPQPAGLLLPPELAQEPACISADFYKPSYLFKPGGANGVPITDSDRPLVNLYPPLIATGSTFTVNVNPPGPAGTQITKVSLMRPSATTHANDMDQRYVPLACTPTPCTPDGNGTLNLAAPATTGDAPPGPYLLFLMNNANGAGHPSIGKFVELWGISTAKHVGTKFCQYCASTFKLDVSWKTDRATDVGIKDRMEVYPPGIACQTGVPSVAEADPTDPGRLSHRVIWQGGCITGTWTYVIKSTSGNTTSTAACLQVVVSSCPSCGPCELE